MTKLIRCAALASGIFAAQLLYAQAAAPSTSAPKPANATGQCKDGSYSTDATKSGACRGHHGVKEWYAAAPTAATAPRTAAATRATSAPAPAQPAVAPAAQTRPQSSAPTQTAAAPAAQTSRRGPTANLANTPVAPGGGPGLVWVNTASNVYHCAGTDFYGKTKAGAYMTEADAKAKGAHGNRGKGCGQ